MVSGPNATTTSSNEVSLYSLNDYLSTRELSKSAATVSAKQESSIYMVSSDYEMLENLETQLFSQTLSDYELSGRLANIENGLWGKVYDDEDSETRMSRIRNAVADQDIQEFMQKQYLEKGILLEIDYINTNSQKYIGTIGVKQSGMGLFGYAGYQNTSVGCFLDTKENGLNDGKFDIGFKPSIRAQYEIKKDINASVNYNPGDSIWTASVSYTPNNQDYISAGVSTDKNSIFSVVASFSF